MKIFRNIALLGVVAALASCEDSETFYTTSYPIVRVEVTTTIKTEETTQAQTTKPTAEPSPAEILIEAINRDALAAAPMLAGGGYKLDFTRYNGGTLTVNTAADTEQLIGTFNKVPGKSELTFFFEKKEYTTKIDSYTDEVGKYKVLLTVNLTKHYQMLYPKGKITAVTRKEYTSTPSK